MLIYSSGLQLGELLQLRLADLQPDQQRLFVYEGKGERSLDFIISQSLRATAILITISLILNFEALSQNEILSKLSNISWQKGELNNFYIENLFERNNYLQKELPENKIVSIYDRYELKSEVNNYFVTFIDYQNGIPIIRSIINQNTNVEYWNYFHKNGKIKLKGFTIGSIELIGIWEKYSESGGFESTINYEKERLNFQSVHEIAKKIGILKSDLDFKYAKENRNWIIEDWTEKVKYTINNLGDVKKEKLEIN